MSEPFEIPQGNEAEVLAGRRSVRLTNLEKLFWPELNITKRDLLQYYAAVAPVLLPHLKARAMVMKRYPNGAAGDFFFMKRVPTPHPEWLKTCPIQHKSGNLIDFPIVDDLASLLWIVNLGCIDLNQWYATCDDVNRPDYVHFDLDPVPGADFDKVRETALIVREALEAMRLPCYPKTTGSRGIHIYVPIVREPVQKEVWSFAKRLARSLCEKHPDLITSEYKVDKRPPGRVLVDYNQNAWGRTLSSVYSVRPKPQATVSTPVTWDEVDKGIRIEDFTIFNVAERVKAVGDLFAPVALKRGRAKLTPLL
ncbi:MAG: non-homologous end-joining DNA ligase [Bryobacteraceae bacterium]